MAVFIVLVDALYELRASVRNRLVQLAYKTYEPAREKAEERG